MTDAEAKLRKEAMIYTQIAYLWDNVCEQEIGRKRHESIRLLEKAKRSLSGEEGGTHLKIYQEGREKLNQHNQPLTISANLLCNGVVLEKR